MSAPATQSSLARRYRVMISRRVGSSWGPERFAPELIPLGVQRWIAPKFDQATIELVAQGSSLVGPVGREGESFPFNADKYVGIDDRIRIVTDHTIVEQRVTLFEGFCTEPRIQWDQGNASVRVTANSFAWRLHADAIVHGQWRRCWAAQESPGVPQATFYNGLPVRFNPGGRPNRRSILYTGGAFPEGSGGRAGVSIFNEPDDAQSRFWTWVDAFDYLQWLHNPDQVYVSNRLFTEGEYADAAVLTLDVDLTGMRLWDALARVARAGGHDLVESLEQAEAGPLLHFMETVRVGSGNRKTIACQVRDQDGLRDVADPQQNNLHSATLTTDAASCITAPVVAGGRGIREVQVELVPAWDPAKYDAEVDPPSTLPVEDDEKASTYYQRYCTGGGEFATYADVGRLWIANTDRRLLHFQRNDMAALAGEPAGTWPVMRYAPLARLAREPAETDEGPLLEISLNGGRWQRLDAAQALGDELGCRIMAEDLRQIVREPADESDKPHVNENLWEGCDPDPLWGTPAKLRITCCVASPHRSIGQPDRRASAGTMFNQRYWLDRGAAYQDRRVGAYGDGEGVTGENIGGEMNGRTIDMEAEAIQAAYEGRLIHGELVTEWIDYDADLTDVIEQIAGPNIKLGVQAGTNTRPPRVVGIRWDLTAWSTFLTLDTDREAVLR